MKCSGSEKHASEVSVSWTSIKDCIETERGALRCRCPRQRYTLRWWLMLGLLGTQYLLGVSQLVSTKKQRGRGEGVQRSMM